MEHQEFISIEFWIYDHIHAQRFSSFVPSIGDEVRFKDVAYKVIYRIWIYDDKYPRVALNMEAVEQSVQADGACTCANIERPMVDNEGICFSCHKPRR